jgi:prepilin-type N-terminal cleavage/methylation domain-containing protein
MKKTYLQKGFTLIELLVVIAIIGILSSVVLASLNTARTKSVDTAIKAALSGARAQAELFYSNGSTYDNVCSTAQSSQGIQQIVLGAATTLLSSQTVGADAQAFVYNAGTANTAGSAVCHDSAAGWAAIVSLKTPTTASAGWCVDSNGASKEATSLAANAVTCG